MTAVASEEAQELRRSNGAVHQGEVAVVGEVVQPAADSETVTRQTQRPLRVKVQVEIIREAIGVRRAQDVSNLIHNGEWKSGARLQQVGDGPVLPRRRQIALAQQ